MRNAHDPTVRYEANISILIWNLSFRPIIVNRSRANFCFKSEKTRSLHECKKRKTRQRLVNDLIYHKRMLVEQLNICILSSELCRDRVLQWPVIYMYCDILPNVFGVVFPPISSFLVLPLLFLYALHVNIHTSVICRVGFPSNCIFIYTVMWFLLFFPNHLSFCRFCSWWRDSFCVDSVYQGILLNPIFIIIIFFSLSRQCTTEHVVN